MTYSYLIPQVAILMPGYSTTRVLDFAALGARLREGTGTLRQTLRVYHDGHVVKETERELVFDKGALVNKPLQNYTWHSASVEWGEIPGFLEEDIRVADGSLGLLTKYNKPAYVLNAAPNRKGYLTNATLKYADPRIVSQIASFGFFLDTFSPLWIDRDRDYGESFAFINPFAKLIHAKILTEDGRSIRRIEVPPMSSRRVNLDAILRDDERSWRGHAQITAINRLVIVNCKHSLLHPYRITDLEHLDPYRTDPTHLPAFKWLRQKVGRLLANRGFDMERLRS